MRDGLGVIWTCDNCGAIAETGLDDEPAGWLIEEPDEDDYPEDEEVPWDLILCRACRAPDVVANLVRRATTSEPEGEGR